MKPNEAAKVVKKKLRGWEPVETPARDQAAADPARPGPSLETLQAKYLASARRGTRKLETTGAALVVVRPKKSKTDASGATKTVVVTEKGIIGMQG